MTGKNEVVKKEPDKELPAVRFTESVIRIFTESIGVVKLTEAQKRLVQNYFMAVNNALEMAEEKRKKKTYKQDLVPVIWKNVNMDMLAQVVVATARIGLDPALPNHVSAVPFKDNALGNYKIAMIDGYRGKELKAKYYGLDVPDNIIIELVYSKDEFKSIKKDYKNKIESYTFNIVNDFDRGEIVGGFYYYEYIEKPQKNYLKVFTLAEILKRKPLYASVEFWGGEKDEYDKEGNKTGKKIEVEGWFDIMCWKTIARAAYGNITLDSNKIDSNYMTLKLAEDDFLNSSIESEISEEGNKEVIDVTDFKEVQEPEIKEPEIKEKDKKEPTKKAKEKPEEGQNTLDF